MLTVLSLLFAAILIALGLAFFRSSESWRSSSMRFLRSEQAAFITFGAGGAWFLYRVWNLSPADNLFNMNFDTFRIILLVLFGTTMIGAFFVVKDFLSVRGLAILSLLFASTGLEAAFGLYDVPQRLYFVTLLYLLIIGAITIGAAPYHLRNLLEWLYAQPARTRSLGATLLGLGVALALVSATY